MKKSEETKVGEAVGDAAMLAPADQPNGVHVGLPDGTTFHIPAGEKPTLVPEQFREAALAAGAILAAGHVDTTAEKEVIADEAAAEARLHKAKNG